MNKRIMTIASMVRKGQILADIGTDHAQLPIMLVQNGTCPKAYASDIASGPLAIAAENIHTADLGGRIETILSDGFEQIPADAQCAVIAGMGFWTAQAILEKAQDRLPQLSQILVQVNGDTDLLRRWISSCGWTVEAEEMVEERDHYYTVVEFSTRPHAPYTYEEILCGPLLIQDKPSEFVRFCRRSVEQLSDVVSRRGRIDQKQGELKKKIAVYRRYAEEKN
jgi:tRNA (adenine22-N1)-methyltransferase